MRWVYTRDYWYLNENSNSDEASRLIGGMELKYQFNDWLSLTLNGSIDGQSRFSQISTGGELAQGAGGAYSTNNTDKNQYTYSFLLALNRTLSDDFQLSFNIGGSQWRDHRRVLTAKTDGDLITPNFFSTSNSSNVPPGSSRLFKKQINSLYAFGQIAYREFLFLDITGRNDWSSTLPKENDSYFYPSLSSSFVFTELFNVNESILTFGKLRASWAKVGNDAQSAYLLLPTYRSTQPYLGNPAAVAPNVVTPGNLLPEETSSVELGMDVRLLNNRIGIDFNWYSISTKNQILRTPVPSSSGAKAAWINAGEIQNKGIEFLINATPVSTKDFNWNVSFNYSRNRNKVIALAQGVESLMLAQNGDGPITVEARPNNPYGDIVTWVPETDPATGELIIGSNGRIFRNFERKVMGNIQPDWTGGLTNELSYKGFRLNALIDFSIGGELYSYTKRWMTSRGSSIESLFGRDASRGGREWTDGKGRVRNDGMIVPGILRDGSPNDIIVSAKEFYNQSYQFNWPKHIVDASYVTLRELTLTYQLPAGILDALRIQRASFALIGRNLWIIHNGTGYLNPVATSYGTGNGAEGLEASAFAPVRSYGVSVKFSL